MRGKSPHFQNCVRSHICKETARKGGPRGSPCVCVSVSARMARLLGVLLAAFAAAELVPRPLTGAIVDAGLAAWQAAAADLACFEGYTEANSNRRLILPEPLEASIVPGATVPVLLQQSAFTAAQFAELCVRA